MRGAQVQFAVAETGGLAPMMVGAAPASESGAVTMPPSRDVVAEVPLETSRIGIVLAGDRRGRAELP